MNAGARLLELIIQAKKEDPETGSFTDFLLANGVTVRAATQGADQGLLATIEELKDCIVPVCEVCSKCCDKPWLPEALNGQKKSRSAAGTAERQLQKEQNSQLYYTETGG